jgi:hypothetical protein
MSLDNILSDIDKLEMLRDATPSNVGFGTIDLINRNHPFNNLANPPYKEDPFTTKSYISQERRPEIVDDQILTYENQIEISKPPFYPSIVFIDEVYKLQMITGFVHTQLLADDAMIDFEVANIPTEGFEIVINDGDKCYVTATENKDGLLSDIAFEKGSIWPDSYSPKLSGGDDEIGNDGYRIWRLCEISTVDDKLTAIIHRTGIIEHYQPRKVENAITTVSSNEARIFKESLLEDGTYRLRVLRGKRGLVIEEGDEGDLDYAVIGLPEGTEDDMLIFDGTNWVVFPKPPSADSTYIHAYQGGHVWLETEECDSPPA